MGPKVRRALMAGALCAGLAVAFVVGRTWRGQAVDRRAAPAVVMAIHDVARLESTSYHVEKVVEVTDEQSRLWGLVQTKDALLLVAVGDVVAGVDLSKVEEKDVTADPATHDVRIRLPAAEVFSVTLDSGATHVYARSTDLLAVRNEALEGEARQRAEDEMRKAALDQGILDRARTSADRTVRSLLHSLGYGRIDIDWGDRG